MMHHPHADPKHAATVREFEFEFDTVTFNYSTPSTMETPDTSPTPIVYYIIALAAVGLCTVVVGAVIYCVFKLTLHWKEGNLRESNVNHEYYEVIDPIYGVVSAGRATDFNHSEIQIKTENNDAYTSLELKETNPHAHMGIHVENNQAYGHITSDHELDVLQMGRNKCYEAAPFNCNISVIPEGVTSTLECYQTQSMRSNENIQQASSGQANVPTSQSDERVEFQSPRQSSVDINICKSPASIRNSSTELTLTSLQGSRFHKLVARAQL